MKFWLNNRIARIAKEYIWTMMGAMDSGQLSIFDSIHGDAIQGWVIGLGTRHLLVRARLVASPFASGARFVPTGQLFLLTDEEMWMDKWAIPLRECPEEVKKKVLALLEGEPSRRMVKRKEFLAGLAERRHSANESVKARMARQILV